MQELQCSSKICVALGRDYQPVDPLLAARKAAICLGIDSSRHQSISKNTLLYYSSSMETISSTFFGPSRFWTASLRFFHRSSMLRSELEQAILDLQSKPFHVRSLLPYYGGLEPLSIRIRSFSSSWSSIHVQVQHHRSV